MTTTLSTRAYRGLLQFIAALAVMLFVPAWTLDFWQAWLYLAVFAAATAAITVFFLRRDPALIERRMNVGPAAEHEAAQKRIQAFASACLCLLFVVAGADRHWRWSPTVGRGSSLAADALVAVGFLVIFFTFRENSFAAATVEVHAAQRVVSSGPYKWVRHPMYTGAILLFLATPVALGSLWAFLPAAGLSATVVIRLLDEERFLTKELAGYDDYAHRVRSRLVPGVW